MGDFKIFMIVYRHLENRKITLPVISAKGFDLSSVNTPTDHRLRHCHSFTKRDFRCPDLQLAKILGKLLQIENVVTRSGRLDSL